MGPQTLAPEVLLPPEDHAPLLARRLTPPRHKRSRRLVQHRRLAAAVLVAAGIAAGCALVGSGGDRASRAGLPDSALASRKALWTDIAQPSPFYTLAAPELEKKPRLYAARQHTGGGRQDTLVFGTLVGAGPFVHMALYRPGSEDMPLAPYFVDLARRAAEDGAAVVRSGQPAPLHTRFGDFAVAEAVLSGPQPRACMAYRLEAANAALRISGYACGSADAPIDRGALACLLDRLDLAPAGQDRDLAKFFTEADRRLGSGCGPLPGVAEAAPLPKKLAKPKV